MAQSFALSIDAGATFDSVEFRYLEDDGVTPVDLTGWVATAQIRKTAGASSHVDFTTTVDVAASKITLLLSATQTASLTESEYVWALEIAKAAIVVRLVEGKVYVSPEVVR